MLASSLHYHVHVEGGHSVSDFMKGYSVSSLQCSTLVSLDGENMHRIYPALSPGTVQGWKLLGWCSYMPEVASE